MEFNTELLHKNFDGEPHSGATVTPIYQSNAFGYESAEKLEKVFSNKAPGFAYTRISNPTIEAFERRIASIEGGIGAVACASGMAAVSFAIMNVLESGDEVIASAGLFGGTIELFRDLSAFGIKVKYVSSVTAESVRESITENTKAVFAELIANPRLDVVDVKAVAEVCHENEIPLIVDSTTATPYLVRPIKLGADIVVHSSSKYINGSSNAISGVIVDGGNFKWNAKKHRTFKDYAKYGKFAYYAKLRNGLWRNCGPCMSPFSAFLNSVGLETLGIRMERICDNALRLAEFLESKDGITVTYPALKNNEYYDLCQKQLGGKGGGILSVRAGSKERAFKLINSLKYAVITSNIGDVRTLVIHPESTIYIHSTTEEMNNAGVYDDTIRISVGIEDIEDILSDFGQATENL